MTARVALCVDEPTLRSPELVGLDGEAVESQDWLEVFTRGDEARQGIASGESLEEAWVVSCDDVEAINLAAALKADRPGLRVALVEFNGCGSLFSRAHIARIDEVYDRAAFTLAYAREKGRAAAPLPSVPVASVVPAAPLPSVASPVSAALAVRPAAADDAGMAQAPGRAFVLPVVSGSGGAGKSSVAVVSAFALRAMGYRTLLLDCDLQFGDVAAMAGLESPLAIDRAISQPELFEREMQRDPLLCVLSAPERLEAAEGVAHDVPELIEGVEGRFDVIVANTGAAWAEQHAALLERSSAALFLIDQRASSLRACRHALELCSRCGIASGPFRFALNRCAKNALLTSIDVSCALQGPPVFELKEGGRDVEEYLGAGAAAELVGTRNEFCASVERMLARLVPGADAGLQAQASVPVERRGGWRQGRNAGRKRGRGLS